jgi:hypothetical protein
VAPEEPDEIEADGASEDEAEPEEPGESAAAVDAEEDHDDAERDPKSG